MRTQFIERFNGSTTFHDPRRHQSAQEAVAYAKELSSRREGEVIVGNPEEDATAPFIDGATFIDGRPVQ